jgi:prepilin-type N-terminal cleavage/methylation domain-containing protein
MSYRRRNPLSPRAFTLVEILVVIAVIGLLVGIAVFGFNAMQRSASKNRTKVALQGAASILAEYDTTTGLRRQPEYMWKGTGAAATKHTPTVAAPINIWQDADPDTAGSQWVTGLVGPADKEEPNSIWASAAARNAGLILGLAGKSTPGAKKILGQLPADGMVTVTDEPSPTLQDGWSNPIIFVPAAGLSVHMADQTTVYTVTSARIYPQGTGTGQLAPGILAPQARPFFASAGPDGIFDYWDVDGNGSFDPTKDVAGGDDNVYSFEN